MENAQVWKGKEPTAQSASIQGGLPWKDTSVELGRKLEKETLNGDRDH